MGTSDQTRPYGGHPPHARGSETSAAAAESVASKAPSRRERALRAFAAFKAMGLTDHELADALDIPLHSAVPIRGGMVEDRLVRNSGRTRLSPYGKPCAVWVWTGEGRQMEMGL